MVLLGAAERASATSGRWISTSGQLTNLTKDDFADYAPTFSPDGKSSGLHGARQRQQQAVPPRSRRPAKKTQLTFGTHDDAAPQFLDADTLVFPSTATDPAKPITPEEARNGNIYNLWTLSLKTGELRQYTDTLTGNLSAVVIKDGSARSQGSPSSPTTRASTGCTRWCRRSQGDGRLARLRRARPTLVTAPRAALFPPIRMPDFPLPTSLGHGMLAT